MRLLWLWAGITLAFLVRLFVAGLQHDLPEAPWGRSIRLDLNRATVAELTALPGIGRRRAETVVLHRVRHGPFRSLNALAEVDGIGPGTLARLRPFVRLSGGVVGRESTRSR